MTFVPRIGIPSEPGLIVRYRNQPQVKDTHVNDSEPLPVYHSEQVVEKTRPIVCARPKVRRNSVCPFCASGKKFKFCHGAPVLGEPQVATAAGHTQEKPASFVTGFYRSLGPMVYK